MIYVQVLLENMLFNCESLGEKAPLCFKAPICNEIDRDIFNRELDSEAFDRIVRDLHQ